MNLLKRISPLSIVLAFALLLSLPRTPRAASLEMYITIDGIPGESVVQAGAIDILSYSQELAVIVDARSKLPGKIYLNDIWFTKAPDTATPGLLQYLASGSIKKDATIKARYAGTGASPSWQIALRNISIKSIDTEFTGGTGPKTEKITLTFGQVLVTYTDANGGGSSGGIDPSQCTPQAEVCDGVDNDCDGAIDEDLPGDGTTTACGQGDCTASGILSCVNGQWVDTCVPGTPSPEVCDGQDNDCNGLIDDGLTVDNDKDGHSSLDSCTGSKDDCNDNDPTNFPGNMETCDGGDNNCDGVVDLSLECVCDLKAVVKTTRTRTSAKVQLVWTPTGAPSYNIYRSTVGPDGPYELLAANYVTTYATYLDSTVKVGVTYWYRIGSDLCGAAPVVVSP